MPIAMRLTKAFLAGSLPGTPVVLSGLLRINYLCDARLLFLFPKSQATVAAAIIAHSITFHI